jgi:hypothetical protein
MTNAMEGVDGLNRVGTCRRFCCCDCCGFGARFIKIMGYELMFARVIFTSLPDSDRLSLQYYSLPCPLERVPLLYFRIKISLPYD